MVSLEAYRNFVAIYRAGSVSGAANARSLTQPAVSQQLASLEAAIGAPLFQRSAKGMVPTARGTALYAQVADSIDQLDRVSKQLRPGEEEGAPTVRLGTTPDFLHGYVLPTLKSSDLTLLVTLGDQRDLHEQVANGVLDAAITNQPPTRRSLQHRLLLESGYILIGPTEIPEDADAAIWLNQQPWVSFSVDRPVTRRFFEQKFGGRFAAPIRLAVNDMRAVIRAVEIGMGFSLVPEYACTEALAEGRVKAVMNSKGVIPEERWWLVTRTAESERPAIQMIASELARKL